MKTRLWKECRIILPAWLFTLLTLAVPQGVGINSLSVALFGIGGALTTASSLGSEFSHNTMALMLSQPVSRTRIWLEKLFVLGLSLVPLLVIAAWTRRPFGPIELGVMAVALFCAGPCLALLTRSTIAAAVFSFVIPILIVLATASFHAWMESRAAEFGWTGAMVESRTTRMMLAMFVIYSVGTFVFGYWQFRRLQMLEGRSMHSPEGSSWDSSVGAILRSLFPDRQGPTRALIKKELRLQQIAFVVMLLFCGLQVLVLGLIRWFKPRDPELYFLFPLVIYVTLIPILIGAHSVAAERNLGVHAWQLTLPIPALKQWLVKLRVCLPLSFLLGVCIPFGWLWVGRMVDEKLVNEEWLAFWPMLLLIVCQLFATSLVLFASSLTNQTLRAAMFGGGLVVGTYVFVNWAASILRVQLRESVYAGFESENLGFAFLAIVFTIMTVCLLGYGFVNFRRHTSDLCEIWKQLAIIFLPVWPFVAAGLLLLALQKGLD